MKNQTLFKIAITTSFIGIILLLFLSQKIDASAYQISDISTKNIDEKIKINGVATKITEKPTVTFITLKDDTGTITVVIFNKEKLNIKSGNNIQVYGKISEYKGQLEVIADSIKKV